MIDLGNVLSMANVCELLRAVMPQVTERVIEHLINRARSRKSRFKKQRFAQNAATGSLEG